MNSGLAFAHVGLLGLLSGLALPALAATTLCTSREKPVFACALSPAGKLVSLCAPRDPAARAGPLAYRFGRPGRVELAYVRPYADFRFVHYFRALVDRYEVSFDNGGYTYAVFDYRDETEKPPYLRGVSILKKGDASSGAGTRLVCKGPVISALHTLKDTLPCDRDNALSLGSCGP